MKYVEYVYVDNNGQQTSHFHTRTRSSVPRDIPVVVVVVFVVVAAASAAADRMLI